MNAIAKKDFLSYFHTFTGWLFTAVLWGFISFFVANYNFLGLRADITNSLTAVEILFLILMPILAMRSFADEQRQKTDQMLFTAPVSVGQVVLGKFLALAEAFTIPVLMICLYPLILSAFGTISWAQNYTAIFGMWLYGLACIAICVFASSLTENPIIAAVLGFVFLFIGYMIPTIQNMVSNSSAVLGKIVGALSITSRFEDFLSGSFSVTSLIYLVTVTALFLFLTTQVLQKRRFSFSKKTFSLGAYSSAMIAVSIAAVIVINLAASQLPESWKSVDVTAGHLYSVSDDTKEVLSNLDEDVTIYVLEKESNADSTVTKLLNNYKSLSKHLTVKYIDPAANPDFIQKYTTDTANLYRNSLVVESSERSKVINYNDLYEYSMDYQTYQQTTTGFDGEGQLTSAIEYVTSSTMPKIYTLTGHGETALSDTFSEAVSKLNIEVANLDLMQNDSVPTDAQAVLILAPTSDLSSDDLSKLEAYFEKGGNLIATTNYQATGDMTNFNTLLSWFGVTDKGGIVMDSDSSRYYQYPSYLLPNVESSPVTDQVTSGNGYIMSPFSQELTYDDSASGITFTPLLQTSESAYVHASADTEADLKMKDDDKTATRTVGIEAVKTLGSTDSESVASTSGSTESVSSTSGTAASGDGTDTNTSTAIIYSSPFLFNDNSNQMVSGSNLSLFTGSISQVVKTDTAVSIPSKSLTSASITVPARTAVVMIGLFVIVIPIVLLVLGLVIWLVRRKK